MKKLLSNTLKAALFATCTLSTGVQAESHYPLTITNYNYARQPVEMTFEQPPQKVVAIYQSAIETLLALGQEDKIVAAAFLDDPVKPEYQQAFDQLKYMKSRPSKEDVLMMEADMIVSWYSLFSDKVYGDVDFWHQRGVNTFMHQNSGVIKPNTLQGEYQDILTLGRIFNVEARAKELVEQMQLQIEQAKVHVADKEPVRAILLEMGKEGQYRIYGEDSIGGDIALQAGAELVATKSGTIGTEQLLTYQPDVIFSVYFGDMVSREEAVNKLVSNPLLSSLPAVANDRVHPMVLSEVYASGVRTHDGIQTIIAGLYPELAQ